VRYGGIWSLAWDKFHCNPKPPGCQRRLCPLFSPSREKKLRFSLFRGIIPRCESHGHPRGKLI